MLGTLKSAAFSSHLTTRKTEHQLTDVAHTVISLAGRFAKPVRLAPIDLSLHLLHGEQDSVVLPARSIEGAKQWQALGGVVTLYLVPGLGQGINEQALRRVVEHLSQT